jgi:cytochrome c
VDIRIRLKHREEFAMRRSTAIASILLALSLITSDARADGRASMDEAKAMAIAAAKMVKERGIESSIPMFMDPAGPFKDRDLYVAVYDRNGICLAHGATAALVGKNLSGLKDIDGKPFGHEAVSVTEPAWIDYKWPNPVTKQIESKSTYAIPVENVIVTVGAYKDK